MYVKKKVKLIKTVHSLQTNKKFPHMSIQLKFSVSVAMSELQKKLVPALIYKSVESDGGLSVCRFDKKVQM